jgi:hypothetical protein
MKLIYTDEWFRSMLASKEITLVLIYHPELCFLSKSIADRHYLDFFTNFIFSIQDQSGVEAYFTPILLFPQIILLVCLVAAFVGVYFSYFTSASKEGLMIDADYLTSSSTAEAEKEISSLDDLIIALLVMSYVFG